MHPDFNCCLAVIAKRGKQPMPCQVGLASHVSNKTNSSQLSLTSHLMLVVLR